MYAPVHFVLTMVFCPTRTQSTTPPNDNALTLFFRRMNNNSLLLRSHYDWLIPCSPVRPLLWPQSPAKTESCARQFCVAVHRCCLINIPKTIASDCSASYSFEYYRNYSMFSVCGNVRARCAPRNEEIAKRCTHSFQYTFYHIENRFALHSAHRHKILHCFS